MVTLSMLVIAPAGTLFVCTYIRRNKGLGTLMVTFFHSFLLSFFLSFFLLSLFLSFFIGVYLILVMLFRMQIQWIR